MRTRLLARINRLEILASLFGRCSSNTDGYRSCLGNIKASAKWPS
jgi:hypothetical protein